MYLLRVRIVSQMEKLEYAGADSKHYLVSYRANYIPKSVGKSLENFHEINTLRGLFVLRV